MLIYEFQKNALEIVKIELTDFNGEKYLNVRVWYDAGKGAAQEFKPSHKGLTLNLDKIAELKKGIDKAYRRVYKETDSDKKARLSP